MGREAKINKKLTSKQQVFVNQLLNGKSATQAALSAYNTTSSKVAASIANENLNKPDVKEALEDALRSQGVSSSTIVKNISKLASSEPAKLSGETVLKANVELLKLLGQYPDNKTSKVNMSFQSNILSLSYEEAKQKLSELQHISETLIADIESS